jgi:hypothetical protein
MIHIVNIKHYVSPLRYFIIGIYNIINKGARTRKRTQKLTLHKY